VRTLLLLLLYGLILGDGLMAGVAALVMWRHRGESRTFKSLAGLYASIAVFLPMLLVAVSYIPRPRPDGFRFWLISGLAILGLGVWFAALDLILIARGGERRE